MLKYPDFVPDGVGGAQIDSEVRKESDDRMDELVGLFRREVEQRVGHAVDDMSYYLETYTAPRTAYQLYFRGQWAEDDQSRIAILAFIFLYDKAGNFYLVPVDKDCLRPDPQYMLEPELAGYVLEMEGKDVRTIAAAN